MSESIEQKAAEDLERAESFDWDKESKDALISMNKGFLALLRAERYAVYVLGVKLEEILQMSESKPAHTLTPYGTGFKDGYNKCLADTKAIAKREIKP